MKIIYLAALSIVLLSVSCKKSSEVPDTPPAQEDTIIWGSSFGAMPGETQAAAYTRVKNAFGNFQIARIYSAGAPVWPSYIPVETVAQISFKYDPKDVLNGSRDTEITNFFTKLATTKNIYWTYFHEPEDDIAKGAFSAEDYRNAFDYIIDLQKKLNKPNLVPTLCLMSYSLTPQSNRNWKDYLPGKVAVVSWDGYYADAYEEDVSKVFGPVREAMKTVDLPWAVAETGVNKRLKKGEVNIDMDVEKRKRLLTALAKDLSTVKPLPVYVEYFDSAPPQDAPYSSWRISDDPTMVAAWKSGQQ